jgi:5-methylcytosine-specific restriction protein A
VTHPLYHTTRWRALRKQQLRREPLCAYCLKRGEVVPAQVADHVIPHRGDEELFWYGKLQSLCIQHHNGSKQTEERAGRSIEVGSDGYPVSPPPPVIVREEKKKK